MRRDASAFPPCGSPRFPTVPIPISIHFSQRTQRAQRSLDDSPGGSICVHLRHLRLKIRNFHGMENVFSNRRNRTQGAAEACRSLRSSRAWQEAMAWKFRIFLGGWSNLIHPRHKGVGVWEDSRRHKGVGGLGRRAIRIRMGIAEESAMSRPPMSGVQKLLLCADPFAFRSSEVVAMCGLLYRLGLGLGLRLGLGWVAKVQGGGVELKRSGTW
jgi:hypothetical protein